MLRGMAQDAPYPIAPAIEEAIERTWPSTPKLEPVGAKGTPLDVLLRVSGFFSRIEEQKRRREEFIRAHAAPVQTAPPVQIQPRPRPAPGPPDLLKVLAYAALGVGTAVIVGKTISTITERKQRQRRLALEAEEQAADALIDLQATVARYQAKESNRRRRQRALAQAQPILDTTALEPKLRSWVSDAVTQNFDQGKAVQHVHRHEHVQHIHPVTHTEQVIERAVPGPRGATGPKGPKGEQGKPGKKGDKGNRGPRGYQGNQGPRGRQGKRGSSGQTGVAPLQGNQSKKSRGVFDD
ncbi:MAG: hypothetical protein CL424_19960 [Acidimicrobiaceae bacterium]|nr:hypothetical protein [Acidimicrobiaceae bacterium]|tara:strand:+ start:1502 stop:2386 length:885 start_codon:yes stop_codon:yes gene_type:complete